MLWSGFRSRYKNLEEIILGDSQGRLGMEGDPLPGSSLVQS